MMTTRTQIAQDRDSKPDAISRVHKLPLQHSSEKLSHMIRWETLSFQRSLPSAAQDTPGCFDHRGPQPGNRRAMKSKIREVFFRPGCYTVSTYKRKTEVGPQERKHHENSHFPRWHSHRVRSVGSGARAHPG